MNFHSLFQSHRLDGTIGTLGVALAWIITRPYVGLAHDARLYAVQALYRLNPENLKNDLFFLYGSQDQFSLFSPIYSLAITLSGLDNAAMTLTFVAHACWIGAAAFMLRGWFSGPGFWLALLLVCALPSHYGAMSVFRYGEPFLTPRIYAEAFALAGLGFAARSRWLYCGGFLAAALALHPLMALPAIGLAIIYSLPNWRLVLTFAIGAATTFLVLALSHVPPFSRLLIFFDTEWHALVMSRAPFLFLEQWQTSDWMSIAINFSVISASWLLAKGTLRRLLGAIIGLSIAGLLLSWIGSTLIQNALLTQVQPWRVLWLLQMASFAIFGWMLANYWRESEIMRAVIIVFVCAWIMRDYSGALIAPLATAGLAWNVYYGKHLRLHHLLRIGVYLLVTLILALTTLNASANLTTIAANLERFWMHISVFLLLMAALFILWRAKPLRMNSLARHFILASLSAILIWEIQACDKRDASAHYASLNQTPAITELRNLIPKNSVVYWEGNHAPNAWFLLNRSHYVSAIQTAGIVFNRDTAIVAAKRAQFVQAFNYNHGIVIMNRHRTINASDAPAADTNSISGICQDEQLDYVITNTPMEHAADIARHIDFGEAARHYLYNCHTHRIPDRTPWPTLSLTIQPQPAITSPCCGLG